MAPKDDGTATADPGGADEGVMVGQHATWQVENFRSWVDALDPESLWVVNGYAFIESKEALRVVSAKLESMTDVQRYELFGLVRAGILVDTQVTATDWGRVLLHKPEQVISQVFCSAFPVSYNSHISLSSEENVSWELLAKNLLAAAYEATLAQAVMNACKRGWTEGSKKVFLTCIGAGAFGNDDTWVADCMNRAFDRYRTYPVEVKINFFREPVPDAYAQLFTRV